MPINVWPLDPRRDEDGPGEEYEVVPLDEPSMEDYRFARVSRCWCVGDECVGQANLPLDEFCFRDKNPTPVVRDSVRDTESR